MVRVIREDFGARPARIPPSPIWPGARPDDQAIIRAMKTVSISELRNRLSYYLRLVRRGEALLVSDRDRVIARIEPATAETRLGRVLETAHLVLQVEAVKSTAVRLLRVDPLRAADALQLGAALCWTRNAPAGRSLITLDQRPAQAAARGGFSVLPLASA